MRQAVEATVRNYQQISARLRRHVIRNVLNTLPDVANGVTMLSKNCGIVSSGTIFDHNNLLSAHYYLTRHLKSLVLKIIMESDLSKLDDRFKAIIQTGRIQVNSRDKEIVPPEFRKALKDAWCGKDHVCPWLSSITAGIKA